MELVAEPMAQLHQSIQSHVVHVLLDGTKVGIHFGVFARVQGGHALADGLGIQGLGQFLDSVRIELDVLGVLGGMSVFRTCSKAFMVLLFVLIVAF